MIFFFFIVDLFRSCFIDFGQQRLYNIMQLNTPRCNIPAWGEWHTIARVKKNKKGELWFLGICSVTTKGTGIQIILPMQGSLSSALQCERWGHGASFHVLRKDGITSPHLSCIWLNVSLQSHILGTRAFLLSESFQVLKILPYPFPLRGTAVAKAPFPSPCHSPCFSVCWIH